MKRKKIHKKDLIPIEKSKRVIYLDKRGRNWNGTVPDRLPVLLLTIVGLLCLLYCIGVFVVGFGTYFFLVWGVVGVVCWFLAWLLSHSDWTRSIPRWLKGILTGVVCLGLALFVFVEGLILSAFHEEPESGADYCVVLGAQWKANGPGDALRRRLDAAIVYLEENPDTKVIVTGGQGSNETIAEGVGIKEYLVAKGIDKTRILVEDKATNTCENLQFSAKFVRESEDKVVLVTSNFHVFRSLKIARKQGYENISGLPADSMAGLLPNNLLREFFGVVKDFIVGNL